MEAMPETKPEKDRPMHRRQMIQGLTALASAGVLGACGGDKKSNSDPMTVAQSSAAETEHGARVYTDADRKFMTRLADIIIPTTDTPGAVEAGAVNSMERVLVAWMDEEARTAWLAGCHEIVAVLDRKTGGSFITADKDAQNNAVMAVDKATYGASDERHDAPAFYREFKASLAAAYYLSEAGAMDELRYELVPGDWKGCVPFDEIGRTWAA